MAEVWMFQCKFATKGWVYSTDSVSHEFPSHEFPSYEYVFIECKAEGVSWYKFMLWMLDLITYHLEQENYCFVLAEKEFSRLFHIRTLPFKTYTYRNNIEWEQATNINSLLSCVIKENLTSAS